jgi:hypothetical protein
MSVNCNLRQVLSLWSSQRGQDEWDTGRMEDVRNAYKILVENLQGKPHLGYQGVHGESILKWIHISLEVN